ncbi:MAG: efflux RND transporter permease subunit [Burkholderiaceae bacterium]|jgi:multidrug efflux pump|nr:efflux RND transporter permease subunit [Burkholderiaceae bacterium]
MAKFFIDRPVFAWVIALFILLAGILSIPKLPISQYPVIAPPTIIVNAIYPGASAQTVDESVTSLIEQEMNGAENMLYIESQSQADGGSQVSVTFKTGTNPELAAVDVQNRLKRIEARLPQPVVQQGVTITRARSNLLMFVNLRATNDQITPVALGDYIARNILNEIKRIPGVGVAQLFGTERAMRVWIDPDKLVGFKLTPNDVVSAIKSQNAQFSAGVLGDLPAPSSQRIATSIIITGQLATPEEFGNIVLRAQPGGATVRIRDIGRVEVAGQSYGFQARLNGKPIAAVGIQLTPTANALETATLVRQKMAELSKFFPPGVEYVIPYDTSLFIKISIEEVVKTLIEAVILVFLVMLLFLQSLRYTIIPAIVVPVSLMGTFAMMAAFGYSINVLTMFGMVLAIGILVDDAIVVVENVERIMSEENLSPREATIKAMGQITSAIVGITLVLIAVFIPMAFFTGSVGAIYRQFSMSMVSSMVFSAIMALTLTPALCATLLKPIAPGHHERKGFFGAFNRLFRRTTDGYTSWVSRVLRASGRYMVIYGVIVATVAFLAARMPTSFLPPEDQGYLLANVQLPPGASTARTLSVMEQAEQYFLKEPGVQGIVSVLGFSFSGNGQNGGLLFVPLKDWKEREKPELSSEAIAKKALMLMGIIRDAIVFTVNPPAIRELGNATGFSLRLQDRAGLGHDALLAARNQLLGMMSKSEVIKSARPEGMEDSPQLKLDIDRDKANALGLSLNEINSTLAATFGSSYVNDFPNLGRQQRVIVQAVPEKRLMPEDLQKIFVRNNQGTMVPLSAFTTSKWVNGPVQLIRFNGYPAMKIQGDAAPGKSSGDALAEVERLVAQLPQGIGYEWAGQSLEEKAAGSTATLLFALALLAVFLVLAALYESTTIPIAVLLVVPLGVLGAVAFTMLRGMPNDVYFKVGLIAIIGLSAKNAILIIEFAKDLQATGMDLVEATLKAVRLRFRPIIMTSFAFILGVLPLVIATGAGSASQRAIGTGVMGGMIAATVLAVFFVPVFFVVVRSIFKGNERQRKLYAAHMAEASKEP